MKKIQVLLLMITVFFYGLFSSQDSSVEELENKLKRVSGKERVDILNKLAFRHHDTKKVFEYGNQALALSRKLKYKKGEGTALYYIGIGYDRVGKNTEALECGQKALQIFEEIKNQKSTADSLNLVGNIYKNIGKYDKALEYHLKSKKIKEEIGDKKGTAISLNNIGNVYRDLRKHDTAIEYFLKSKKIKEEIGDKKGISNSLTNIGKVYKKMANYDKAVEYFLKALKMSEEIGYKLGQSISLDEIAFIYRYQSNYHQSLAYNLKALKINREMGDKIQIANSLTYIGNNYMYLSNYKESLKYHLEALKIYEELGQRNPIAISLNNVGGIYFHLKKYDMALEYFLRSLELKKAAGNKKSIASNLNNIGSTYHMMGNYRQALEYSQQAMEIYEEMGDKYGKAISLSSIGSAYFQLKEYQKGLEYQLKSLEIRKALGNKEGTAVCLDNIGQFYKETGNHNKALDYFEQGLTIAKEIKAKDLMRDIYDRIAKTYSEQGNYKKALEYYQLHSAVKDDIINKESNDKIAELQTKYETEKKEKQIEILQKNSEIQQLSLSRERFKSNAFIVGFVLALIILLLLFKKYIFLLAFWKKRNYIGHYKIINEIDSGGMGIVYRANHLLDKSKLVAIKVMKEESSKDNIQRKRFLNEALIIDQLHHPNIVKVIERGEYNNRLFIAMELLEGKPLSHLIKAGLKLPIKEAAAIMDQLLDAIFKIHSKGIIHRDLKPDNIMLIDKDKESKNFVKILDFGLAKNRSLTQLTETGEILGTINYLPPERISNQEFSGAGDIYSLGVIFYEMMTLEKPFLGELQVDVIRSILEKEPIEPARFNPDIPVQLNELIMKMMYKDPLKRPPEKILRQTLAQYL